VSHPYTGKVVFLHLHPVTNSVKFIRSLKKILVLARLIKDIPTIFGNQRFNSSLRIPRLKLGLYLTPRELYVFQPPHPHQLSVT